MILIFLKIVLQKSKSTIDTWLTESQFQINKINSLRSDLDKFTMYLENELFSKN